MRYYAGQRVTTSGIYHSAHIFHRDHDADLALIVGQLFPRCGKECRDIMYTFVKVAPGAGELSEFGQPKPKRKGPSAA